MTEFKPSALNALLSPPAGAPCYSAVSPSTSSSERPQSFSHAEMFRLKPSSDMLVPFYLVGLAGAFFADIRRHLGRILAHNGYCRDFLHGAASRSPRRSNLASGC